MWIYVILSPCTYIFSFICRLIHLHEWPLEASDAALVHESLFCTAASQEDPFETCYFQKKITMISLEEGKLQDGGITAAVAGECFINSKKHKQQRNNLPRKTFPLFRRLLSTLRVCTRSIGRVLIDRWFVQSLAHYYFTRACPFPRRVPWDNCSDACV